MQSVYALFFNALRGAPYFNARAKLHSHPYFLFCTILQAPLGYPSHAKAMILAAGRGERMRPLTDTTPKPLLRVNGKPLLSAHLDALAVHAHLSVVINTAWLESSITDFYGLTYKSPLSPHTPLTLQYSRELQDFGYALETAGGIVRALGLLEDVFWVLAGDVYVPSFAFSAASLLHFANSKYLAHLFLVPNPVHHAKGDFALDPNGVVQNIGSSALPLTQTPPQTYTYSTIGLYKKALFKQPFCDIPENNPRGTKAPLAPVLRKAIDQGLVSGELFFGPWTDVGTPERLRQLNASSERDAD